MNVGRGVIEFLGIPVASCTTREFIEWFVRTVDRKKQEADGGHAIFVTYLNAWCSNIGARDTEYATLLRGADCVYADGQAIVWASRLLGSRLPERVNAADFMVDFCRTAADHQLTFYLLGSAEGVAAKAALKLQEAVPGLKVVGTTSGYHGDGEEVSVKRIAAASPDILLLGMGVPLQEKWARRHMDELNVRAIWCVGAMFEYYGEARTRAPVWVRRAGLEWAFRLVLEPRRLWRRYILGNARFVLRVLRARLR